MAINKVVYNGGTLIDLTGDTVTANTLMQGYTAHDKTGAIIIGTATGGSEQGTVWQDGEGYVHLDDESGISLQIKSATPSETAQTITADEGYYALQEVNVGAISSSYVGSGITRRSSSDLTVSGATVTAPSGYYSASASKSVASGTAGTPTATKGTVSNHSVSVTPSVTNTTGYITGGTKTGTAVSVSASELVSGTKSITENGTGIDVTNYASVDVNVSGGGGSAVIQSLNVTQNGTYTAPSGVDGYSPITVNVSGGGGGISGVATGTLTADADISADTTITNISEIGFVPTQFMFYANEDTKANNAIYASTFISVGTVYFKSCLRYSAMDRIVKATNNTLSWTSRSTGHLYYISGTGDIQIIASSSYILKAGTYTWWAIE